MHSAPANKNFASQVTIKLVDVFSRQVARLESGTGAYHAIGHLAYSLKAA
jgi:hypothetical protein